MLLGEKIEVDNQSEQSRNPTQKLLSWTRNLAMYAIISLNSQQAFSETTKEITPKIQEADCDEYVPCNDLYKYLKSEIPEENTDIDEFIVQLDENKVEKALHIIQWIWIQKFKEIIQISWWNKLSTFIVMANNGTDSIIAAWKLSNWEKIWEILKQSWTLMNEALTTTPEQTKYSLFNSLSRDTSNYYDTSIHSININCSNQYQSSECKEKQLKILHTKMEQITTIRYRNEEKSK